MNAFWNRISNIGINKNDHTSEREVKKMVFFNQVMFIGLLGTMFQIALVWPLIGWNSLVFLVAPITSVIGIVLNSKGKFKFSKWFFVIIIYTLGWITTTMLGGAGLYHLGIFSTYTFGLILFDSEKEKVAHLIGVGFMIFVLLTGELGWFDSPDFSNHEWNTYFRWGNIFSLIGINSMLINFILKLNKKTEVQLVSVALEKEAILQKVQQQANELEEKKSTLEDAIALRTEEILMQRDALEVKNREKEVLLQEVHHRVKNNLQIIVSLINLQRNKHVSADTEKSLKEIQTRVLSMSLVHRKMYENPNSLEIKLHEYCNQLLENIGLLYDVTDVEFSNNIPKEISLNMDKAIPLGLILNEIVVNYYKHAYKKTKSNKFDLIFNEKDGCFHFQCKDNGNGFPEIFDASNSTSIGLEIIEGLVGQIDGVSRFYNEGGAVYEFSMRM